MENPGVWGHGAGVIITVCCATCGIYREKDTWAQDRATGEQGLESVAYRNADDASIAWVDDHAEIVYAWEAVPPDGYRHVPPGGQVSLCCTSTQGSRERYATYVVTETDYELDTIHSDEPLDSDGWPEPAEEALRNVREWFAE